MRIEVNGVRLFFDVEGAKWVPDGKTMRSRPTLLLLHGGPGMDHTGFKPAFAQFADIAQVVYLDHRGNGRSDREPQNLWTLAQWGDDVQAFCQALEIEKPIVMGQSFGGFVAMSYATRHPTHPGKLILSSTSAAMRRYVERSVQLFHDKGGAELAAMARHALGTGFDSNEFAQRWLQSAMPFYNTKPASDPDASSRTIMNISATMHVLGPGGESSTFDFLAALANIQCPTLVLGGEEDPMTPIEAQVDIAAAIPAHLVQFERVPNAGHGPYRDDPRVYDMIRSFILA